MFLLRCIHLYIPRRMFFPFHHFSINLWICEFCNLVHLIENSWKSHSLQCAILFQIASVVIRVCGLRMSDTYEGNIIFLFMNEAKSNIHFCFVTYEYFCSFSGLAPEWCFIGVAVCMGIVELWMWYRPCIACGTNQSGRWRVQFRRCVNCFVVMSWFDWRTLCMVVHTFPSWRMVHRHWIHLM